MLNLPSDLDAQCFRLFLQCEEFDNDRSLRAMFVTTELAPFRDSLPGMTGNKKLFVTEVKSYLLEYELADGRVLLLPFLQTLRDRYPEEGALYGDLNDLYQGVQALQDSQPSQARSQSSAQPSPPGATLDRADFREKLDKYFSQSELRTICFDLTIPYDNFRQTKGDMILDLLEYCERNGRTQELLNKCRSERSHVTW